MHPYDKARQVDLVLTALEQLEAQDTSTMTWKERQSWATHGAMLQDQLEAHSCFFRGVPTTPGEARFISPTVQALHEELYPRIRKLIEQYLFTGGGGRIHYREELCRAIATAVDGNTDYGDHLSAWLGRQVRGTTCHPMRRAQHRAMLMEFMMDDRYALYADKSYAAHHRVTSIKKMMQDVLQEYSPGYSVLNVWYTTVI